MKENSVENSVDFLIIGASVAGSVLAAKLASHGKVIFVDKYIPGTWMNCGGGMPHKVFKLFDVDIPFNPITKACMHINGKNYEFPCNYVVVDRSELDHALYEKACKAGAEFKKMNFISSDSKSQVAKFKVKSRETTIKYKKLIIANGFHPGKDPFSGLKRNLVCGAARVEIIDCESPFPHSFYFDIYSKNPPGYSWLFPMPDGKINIGTGGFSGSPISACSLMDFKKSEKISGTVVKKGGGVLPIKPENRIHQGSIYLFGDAAGMVNALNGEGLLHIVKFAPKFVDGLINDKNLNIVWKTSSTFWFLWFAALVFNLLACFGDFFKISLYPIACRFVAFNRRILGKMI